MRGLFVTSHGVLTDRKEGGGDLWNGAVRKRTRKRGKALVERRERGSSGLVRGPQVRESVVSGLGKEGRKSENAKKKRDRGPSNRNGRNGLNPKKKKTNNGGHREKKKRTKHKGVMVGGGGTSEGVFQDWTANEDSTENKDTKNKQNLRK